MGFRARSAEEMYRYALRLDDRDRSLGDGFGWTLLLLGDSGEVTREFLLRYGVELSAKTAHRARFAFFSGISERDTQGFIESLNFGHSARGFLDLLQSGLRRSSGRRGSLDWERDGWRELRPDTFTPFTDARHVHAHISEAFELLDRSLPGVEAGARFAQALGIGRHVPCLLVFTDLGAPGYHVLPFGDRSATEIYDRVRRWIDAYYEINGAALDHWSSVEMRIHNLCADARTSLQRITRWPVQRREDWLELSLLSESARIARAHPEAAPGEVEMLARRHRIVLTFNSEVYGLLRRVRKLATLDEKAAHLTRTADGLRDTPDPERVGRLLTKLVSKPPPGLSASSHDQAKAAAAFFSRPWPSSPEQELFRWWRRFGVPAAAKRVFSQFRSAWGESGAGTAQDYDVFWRALGECPLAGDAEETADHALARLSRHRGVSPAALPAWTEATASLRRHLSVKVRACQQAAPAWLLRLSPPVLLRECLFTGGLRHDEGLRECLPSFPRLAAGLGEIAADPEQYAADDEQRHASCFELRDAVVRAVSEDAHQAGPEASRAVLAQDIAATLEEMRAKFQTEVELNAQQQVSQQAGIAHLGKNLELAAQLDSALRAYHEAVHDIVYPHMSDPAVIALPGRPDGQNERGHPPPSPVAAAMGLDAATGPLKAAEQMHAYFPETRDATHEALSGHEQAQRDGERWTPGARFADVLTAVLPEPRAAHVLAPFPGASPAEKAARAVRDQRVVELLDALSRRELAELMDHVRPTAAPRPRLRPEQSATPAEVLALFGLRVPPRVFVSYAHEDDRGVHTGRVRTLWRLLRGLGIDARLDLPVAEEPQDWALWTHEQYRAADYVLVVASPAYKRRAEGTEAPGTGEGVIWEARLIRSEIYANPDGWYRRVLRVVLPGGSLDDLPDYLGGRTTTYYTVDPLTPAGAEKLVRYVTGQPYETGTPIGTVPHLPPRSPGG